MKCNKKVITYLQKLFEDPSAVFLVFSSQTDGWEETNPSNIQQHPY